MPARLPALRLRRAADAARDAAPRDPAVGGRGRAQPARAVGAPARGGEGLASCRRGRRDAAPRTTRRHAGSRSRRGRSRPAREAARAQRRRARARGAILWIAVSARAARRRRLRQPRRAAAQSRSSTRRRSSGRSSAPRTRRSSRSSRPRSPRRASRRRPRTQDGLVAADPSTIGYVDLAPLMRSVREKQANRRIRLLLALFVARRSPASLARAVWLQGVDGRPRSRSSRTSQHRETLEDPGRPRHDLRPHGRPARDRRADDDGLRRPAAGDEPARGRAGRARRSSASTRTRSTRSSRQEAAGSSTSSASPTRRRPRPS